VSWQGQFYAAAAVVDPILCPPAAADPINLICDHFQLSVQDAGTVAVTISWATADDDFDLYVFDSTGLLVASSADTGTTSETVSFSSPPASYEVRVVPFEVSASDYQGTATLSGASGGAGGQGGGGGGVDPPLFIGDSRVVEGDTGTTSLARFAVWLGWSTISPVTVNYVTADPNADGSATAGADFVPSSGTVVIPPGQTQATFTVPVVGDNAVEPDETFFVDLTLPDPPLVVAKIQDGQGVATIVDDDTRHAVRGSGKVGDCAFALVARENRTGKLRYRGGGTAFYSRGITATTWDDLGRSAEIQGTGVNAGHAVTWVLDVVDRGPAGTLDTFTLVLSDGSRAAGTLSSGDIEYRT
jgi:hypothetical protein